MFWPASSLFGWLPQSFSPQFFSGSPSHPPLVWVVTGLSLVIWLFIFTAFCHSFSGWIGYWDGSKGGEGCACVLTSCVGGTPLRRLGVEPLSCMPTQGLLAGSHHQMARASHSGCCPSGILLLDTPHFYSPSEGRMGGWSNIRMVG